jgi:hypothetical protein
MRRSPFGFRDVASKGFDEVGRFDEGKMTPRSLAR